MNAFLRAIIWTDYKLALLFTVIIPLVLLVWAVIKQSEAIARLLIIYWRVASLLAISNYLLIAAIPIGYISALAGRILVPLSLWFWVDLNEEIDDIPVKRPLKMAFAAWRWAITVYMLLGAIVQIPALQCAVLNKPTVITNSFCRLWLEAPWGYKQLFHPNYTEGFLGFLAIVGLLIYAVYFSYFILIRLGKQGRSAIEQ